MRKQMKKIIKIINKFLINMIDLLKHVLVFTILSGLLFNDPFGTIEIIGNLLNKIDNGLAGVISVAIILLMYRGK